jgi:hypothetical protein
MSEITNSRLLEELAARLTSDERVLSARERALLASVLSSVHTSVAGSPELREAVLQTVSDAIGQAVLQRVVSGIGHAVAAGLIKEAIEGGATRIPATVAPILPPFFGPVPGPGTPAVPPLFPPGGPGSPILPPFFPTPGPGSPLFPPFDPVVGPHDPPSPTPPSPHPPSPTPPSPTPPSPTPPSPHPPSPTPPSPTPPSPTPPSPHPPSPTPPSPTPPSPTPPSPHPPSPTPPSPHPPSPTPPSPTPPSPTPPSPTPPSPEPPVGPPVVPDPPIMPPSPPSPPFTPGPFFPPGPIFPPGPVWPPPFGGLPEIPAGPPVTFVALNDLLGRQDVERLFRYALSREQEFREVRTIAPAAEGAATSFEQRSVRRLVASEQEVDVVSERVRAALPRVLAAFGIEPVTEPAIEAAIVTLGDGDALTVSVPREGASAGGQLAFLYFFHREPVAFEGGTLVLREAPSADAPDRKGDPGRTIRGDMRHNAVVFLGPGLEAAIDRVRVPSKKFADGAFAVVGVLRV